MRTVAVSLSLIALVAGLVFAVAHSAYWTQAGNCSPCHPERFHYSIVAGLTFFLANLLVWWNSTPNEPWEPDALRVSLRLVSRHTLDGLLVSFAASFVLIGLFILPVVAIASSGAYAYVLSRACLAKTRG
jgi:hypothetical protein